MDRRYSDVVLLLRLARYAWRYHWRLVQMTLATLAVAASSAYLVWVVKSFLDVLTSAGGLHESRTTDLIAMELAALAPLVALAFHVSWVQGQWLANRCLLDLRDDFLRHLIGLELGFHSDLARGELISRMTSDIAALQILLQGLFGKVIQRPAEALGIITYLFVLNWRFAAITFLVLAPVTLLLARILRKTRTRGRTARETLAENVVALEQITSGIRVIKAMGSAELECSRYGAANERLFAANMRLARSRGQSEALTNGGIFLLMAIGLWGGTLVMSHHWSDTRSLAIFMAALLRLTNLMRTGTRTWGEIQENLPAAERVFEVLDRPSRIVDAVDAIPCPVPRTSIRLEGVSFRYQPASEDVLHDVSLEIPVGKVVALVGPSGGGKSTILDLIPRFRDVTGGRITLDGIDIRSISQASLVHQFAIVQQDSFLFNDTILNNIRYGRPAATIAEVEAAARRAHIHDTIIGLEGGEGYATVVGDRGERLSGGQRQRVAIARALLRDAPILLLDEPTSALDAESERHVQEALDALMQGRTSVVVAHRLSTIQHADVIHVLSPETGCVVESGTHRELVQRDGEYARLVRLQQLSSAS